jgi:hypothetical protein
MLTNRAATPTNRAVIQTATQTALQNKMAVTMNQQLRAEDWLQS